MSIITQQEAKNFSKEDLEVVLDKCLEVYTGTVNPDERSITLYNLHQGYFKITLDKGIDLIGAGVANNTTFYIQHSKANDKRQDQVYTALREYFKEKVYVPKMRSAEY